MKKVFLLTALTASLLLSCNKGGGNNQPDNGVNCFPEEEIKAFLLERGADLTHYNLPIEVKEAELLSYSIVDDEECPYFNVLVEDKDFDIAHNIHNFMTAQNWYLEGDIKIDPYEQIGVEYWPEGTELYINIYAYTDLIEIPEGPEDDGVDYNKTITFRLQDAGYIAKETNLNGKSYYFDGFSFSFGTNGGSTNPKSEKSNAIYLYTSNQFTVGNSNAYLRKMEFTLFAEDPKDGDLDPKNGTVTKNEDITTWICSSNNVTEETFTAVAQYRFEELKIYYYEEESEPPVLGLKTIAEVKAIAAEINVPTTNNGWYLSNTEVTVNIKAIDAIDSVATGDGLDGGARGKVLCVDSTGYIICSSGVSKNNPIDLYQRVKNYIKKGTTTYTVTGHIAFFNDMVEIKVDTYEYKSNLVINYDLNDFVAPEITDYNYFLGDFENIKANSKGYGVGKIVKVNNVTYFKKYNDAGSYYFLTEGRILPFYSLLDKDRASLIEGNVYNIIALQTLYVGRPSLRILKVENSESDPSEVNLKNYVSDISVQLASLYNDYYGSPNGATSYFYGCVQIYKATVYISRYADDKYTFNTSYYYDKSNKEYTTGNSQVDAARHYAIGVFNDDLDYHLTIADYVLENCHSEAECEASKVTIYFTLAFQDLVDGKHMWRAYILEDYVNYIPE